MKTRHGGMAALAALAGFLLESAGRLGQLRHQAKIGELLRRRKPDVLSAASKLRGERKKLLAEIRAAFSRLVRRHEPEIARRMWRFTRDPAAHADLVSEVFVSAYESLPGYRAEAPFSHWLSVIAVRAGYAHWRRRRNETVPLAEAELERLAQPPGADAAEASDLVHRALGALPPRDRLVLTLLYLEGHSMAEIVGLTGWSVVMVKVQAWR